MVLQKAHGKVCALEELAAPTFLGSRVVLCHGVFDLLHIGHIRHLQEAKALGDFLLVTITPDEYVNKGPGRPAFTSNVRAEAVAALNCVDYVALNRWPTAVETIKLLRPNCYVKGPDYADAQKDHTGGIGPEEDAVNAVGGRLVITGGETFSSTKLLNDRLSAHPKDVADYLSRFASCYSSAEVLRDLDAARSLKVLMLGETIIDEYVNCEAMGKAGKDPVLAVRRVGVERYAGGIIAAANHLAAFVDNVTLVTLAQSCLQESFPVSHLAPGVQALFLSQASPTIVKRRYVELYPRQNLFEEYEMAANGISPSENLALCSALEADLPSYDLVLVIDYGHGMIGPEAVDLLCSRARFLAVNTQLNAGNGGLNVISKYKRADYIALSEKEIRLDARSRTTDLSTIIKDLANRLSCPRITVTRGQNGCLCFGEDEGFFAAPALGTQVVDRLGAGDAVLAVTSLCAVQGVPMEVIALIANAVGAQVVATTGHPAIKRLALLGRIKALLP